MNAQSSTPNVKIVKITAMQAIAVALITAVGTFSGYFVGGKGAERVSPTQHWLQIHKVEGTKNDLVKIVATASGVNYVYPSRFSWAEIGDRMSSERFPLPLGSGSYRISFSGSVTYPGPVPVEQTASQKVHDVKLSQIPTGERIYELYLIKGEGISAEPRLKVTYSVE